MSRRVRPGDDRAHVLVVCMGNICRSPLGAALIEHQAAQWLGEEAALEVSSAGVHGLTGEGATSEICAEGTSRGVDLSRHRAQVAERHLVEASDLVIAMTARQRTQLARIAPSAKERTFTLKELVRLASTADPPPQGLAVRERLEAQVRAAHTARALSTPPDDNEDVADPYGGSREGYSRCAEEIEGLVAKLAPWLFGPVVDRTAEASTVPAALPGRTEPRG